MENNTQEEEVSAPTEIHMVVEKKENFWKKHAQGAWDLIRFAVIALAIVIPIRLWIAQPFIVSGESMFPTFNHGEYLIIDELSYNTGEPHRGDVVIFHYPKNPSVYFIKRVIGLPGEIIEITNGKVKIIPHCPDTAICADTSFTLTEPYINEKFTTTGRYELGPEDYFVLGDNRNRSSDSRSWGTVPRKLMVGRAYLRLLPFTSVSYLPGYFKEAK